MRFLIAMHIGPRPRCRTPALKVGRDITCATRYVLRAMAGDETHTYLIALGSNVRHQRYSSPRGVLGAALREIERCGIELRLVGPVISNPPLGPSQRLYANSAAVVHTSSDPLALLDALQQIERKFGRKRMGSRWSARTLDLDIILWSGGIFAGSTLAIPHREFRNRDFVLTPAAAIAPDWRDPITNYSLRQLKARLTKPRHAPR